RPRASAGPAPPARRASPLPGPTPPPRRGAVGPVGPGPCPTPRISGTVRSHGTSARAPVTAPSHGIRRQTMSRGSQLLGAAVGVVLFAGMAGAQIGDAWVTFTKQPSMLGVDPKAIS